MDPARMVKSAVDLWAAGDRGRALELASEIVKKLPYQPRANELLGAGLAMQGRWAEAAAHVERAIKGEPTNPRLHFALGSMKGNTGDVEGAAASFRKALEVGPGFMEAVVPFAIAAIELGRSADAEETLRRGLARQPNWPDAIGAMASVLTDRAQTIEAERVLRDGVAKNPGNPALLRMLCQTLNYVEGAGPAEAKLLRERQGRLLGEPAVMKPGAVPHVPDPERRLRVGYLSADLRLHSVSFFAEPVITHHDPERFEVFCYYTGAREDAVSGRIRRAVPQWKHIVGMPDAALLQMIRGDQIDILIELSGMTGGDRLAIMAQRAAPVQATYIGCPSSTGVPAIDYRLVDEITDPGGAEIHANERLVRIPGCFLCYRPPEGAPEPSPPPSSLAPDAPITFGSFNNLAKLSPGTAALWTRTVKSVPGSRLLLKAKALGDETAARSVRERFAAAGLEQDRLLLVGDIKDPREHLAAYSRIDIALDPFPYNGTTTTCEALWMGVPVVTLRGSLHAGRVGASLLTAVGCGGWVAGSPDEYVRIAAELAGDRERLIRERAGLRAKIAASRLCDAGAHTRAIELIYRDIWKTWCAS